MRVLGVAALLGVTSLAAAEKSVFARLHPAMTRAEVEKLGNKVSLGAYQGHLISSFTSEGALQRVDAIATFRQGSCPEALESVRRYLEQDFGAPRSLKPHIPLRYGGLHQRCHDWRLGAAWLQVCCARHELKEGRPPLMNVSASYGVKGRDAPIVDGCHGEDSLIIPLDGFH
ncbi:hypothetical protein HNV28_10480 [Myxococcus xanthus]|uniref:Uncharacterized protein n=2 Tax=Myxococcus xanthus TaxID=34 RepID=A0A7Y4MQQ0_MYXXA|nr:hypothetical protein [Myxococcus xanthus]NOJ78764.1 hypothetical protein [Myxococcus xanthus]NOJ84203.1 hypothetical protein [Myxococcus xanthus]